MTSRGSLLHANLDATHFSGRWALSQPRLEILQERGRTRGIRFHPPIG